MFRKKLLKLVAGCTAAPEFPYLCSGKSGPKLFRMREDFCRRILKSSRDIFFKPTLSYV